MEDVMAEREIKVTFANLSNNIAKLKNISDYLAEVNNYNDSFSESSGASKDALSEKLKTTIAAGNALKKAVDELIADLEYDFSKFKSIATREGKSYQILFSSGFKWWFKNIVNYFGVIFAIMIIGALI